MCAGVVLICDRVVVRLCTCDRHGQRRRRRRVKLLYPGGLVDLLVFCLVPSTLLALVSGRRICNMYVHLLECWVCSLNALLQARGLRLQTQLSRRRRVATSGCRRHSWGEEGRSVAVCCQRLHCAPHRALSSRHWSSSRRSLPR